MALNYKLGVVSLAPISGNGCEYLHITQTGMGSTVYVPLGDFDVMRMRSMPIARASTDPLTMMRLTVSGRVLYNRWPSPYVTFFVAECVGATYSSATDRAIVSLTSPRTSLFPVGPSAPHLPVSATNWYFPFSDDVAHGTEDMRLGIFYSIRWAVGDQPTEDLPTIPGPPLTGSLAFEWSGLNIEVFT